jgi:hypothetical protein
MHGCVRDLTPYCTHAPVGAKARTPIHRDEFRTALPLWEKRLRFAGLARSGALKTWALAPRVVRVLLLSFSL